MTSTKFLEPEYGGPERRNCGINFPVARDSGGSRAWKAREALRTGRARFPILLEHYFLAVTRSALLSYSVFGMMRRVVTSPGSV